MPFPFFAPFCLEVTDALNFWFIFPVYLFEQMNKIHIYFLILPFSSSSIVAYLSSLMYSPNF